MNIKDAKPIKEKAKLIENPAWLESILFKRSFWFPFVSGFTKRFFEVPTINKEIVQIMDKYFLCLQ